MNLLVFRKTYRPATQALDMGAEVQILALDLPGLILAHYVFDVLRRQSGVGAPLVGVYAPDGQVGHFLQQFGVTLVGAPAVVVGHHPPTYALDGVPRGVPSCPVWVGLAAHVRPELVDLAAVADQNVQFGQLASLNLVDQVRVDLAGRFFFKCLITVFLLIDRMRAVSRTPLLLSICCSIC